MASPQNDNFQIRAPKHIDDRSGPWSSVAEAIAGVPEWRRVVGLSVNVIEEGKTVQYWWEENITDAGLIKKESGGGSGGHTPQYNPITTILYYEDGKAKQIKTDIGSSKFIDKRVAYHTTGDNIGKADFTEIKDESTDPALWKKIQYNYTEKVLTSTTVTDIVAWTITI